MEIKGQRRMTVSARMAMARDLPVFHVAVLGNLVEIEIQSLGIHTSYGYVRGGDGHVHQVLHLVPQKVPQAGTNPTDGPETTHGPTSTPLPTHIAADHRVVVEALM
jgi:hypothetical protein